MYFKFGITANDRIMFPLFLVFNVILYGLVVHAKWSDKDTQKFSLINIYLGKTIEYQVAVRKKIDL